MSVPQTIRIANRVLESMLPTIIASPSVHWLQIGSLAKAALRQRMSVHYPNLSSSARSEGVAARTPSWIEPLAVYPTCIQLECMPFDKSVNAWEKQLSDNIKLLSGWLGVIEQAFDRTRPRVGLVVQGYEPVSALIRMVAIERGVPIMAIENTALSDRMVWDCVSAITTNKSMATNFFWRHEHLVSEDIANRFTEHVIETTKQRKSIEHQSPGNQEFSFDGEYAVFLGQVYTDSSVLFGLGNWQSPEEVIKHFLLNCARKNLRAVIKLHPKEHVGKSPFCNEPYNHLTYRKLQTDLAIKPLLQNDQEVLIDWDNRLDTYQLIEGAKCCATISSQSGLESAIRGIPTMVCGESFFSSLGFTLSANTETQFKEAFDLAVGNGVMENKHVQLARKFAFIYFEHYCRPKSMPEISRLLKATIASKDLWACQGSVPDRLLRTGKWS